MKRLSKQILCISLLTFYILVNECPAVDVTSVTQNASSVGEYEKFEATFTLSSSYSNPFDTDVIDITANIIEPDSNNVTVPVFFYREHVVIGSSPEKYGSAGPEYWKLRFAPSKLGQHTYSLTITDSSGTLNTAVLGSFECIESSNKGFIRVNQENPKYLKYDDGSTRLNIGHNVCWMPDALAGWQGYFSKMSAAGENWTRIWMCPWGDDGGVVIEESTNNWTGYFDGVGILCTETAQRLDGVIELAQQYGIAIQLVFQYHGALSTTTNAQWNVNPYNIALAAEDGGFLENAEDFFTDAEAIRLSKNKYRYIVARWGYSTSILAWELFNEVQFTDGWRLNSSSVVTWHDDMSTFLNDIDPFNHPVTTSSDSFGFDEIWPLDNIDIIQIHYYGHEPVTTFEDQVQRLSSYGKPVILGEFGIGGDAEIDPDSMSEPYRTQIYEALHMHNGIWSSFHVNSSAHLWWWDCYINPLDLYGEYEALAVYADGEDLAPMELSAAPRVVEGADEIYAVPGLTDFWAVSTQTVFTLEDGIFPGTENLSQWLQGSSKPDYRSDPTFILDMPVDGYLIIHVESVSSWGNNSLRVLVDSEQVFESSYANGASAFTISVPLSAGFQSVQVENTGQDWFHISYYEFAPENTALLDSIGLMNNNHAYIWIYDKGSTYGNTANGIFQDTNFNLNGLDDGTYDIQVYATRNQGGVIAFDRVNSSDGTLTYSLPDFSKDIAVKVKPACVVDIDDLRHFAQQWLSLEPDNAADLRNNGEVNLEDFGVLSELWLDYCPAQWPWR